MSDMFEEIQRFVLPESGSPVALAPVDFSGTGTSRSLFAVSDLAQGTIGAAVSGIQTLRCALWGAESDASVERGLSSLWCKSSFAPIDWEMPSEWDAFAADYQVKDGWVRLHTNAKKHRLAALNVLGDPKTPEAARRSTRFWAADELESSVVFAGGCAAQLRTEAAWATHPQGAAVAKEPVVAWEKIGATDKTISLKDPTQPLSGLRVLDLTRVLAGPVCTRFLASFGADVLRIDPPEWDEDSLVVEMTVGKHCAGLNLKRENDRAIFEDLLSTADVFVHGYRTGALTGLGYDRERLQELNPQLIEIALNAYGWTGPWAQRRGFDSLVQRSCGIVASCTAHESAEMPVALPFQALDHATGYLMAAAVIHAVREKVTSGRSYSARLSLARQAKLLMDAPRNISPVDVSPVAEQSDYLANPEQTPWGMIQRLRFPFNIDGVSVGWATQSRQLRSDKAAWQPRERD